MVAGQMVMNHWEILLLRHGKSSWANPNLLDFDRPLKKRGWRDSLRMGQLLKHRQLLPKRILCSSAKRTRQTAERVCEGLGLANIEIQWCQALYHATGTQIFDLILAQPVFSPILIIGHNPGMETLLTTLAPDIETPFNGKLFPTAALAHLTAPVPYHQWSPDVVKLRDLTRPKQLDPV